jgi:hypothetical protein
MQSPQRINARHADSVQIIRPASHHAMGCMLRSPLP